ncbi:hypothetical protein Godav_003873 [Gossypium davidsonii]|uniref:DUF4283 domain-containing protein n=1 Tax=Gossypium davidsonii TaxID=34287 RepID=A0A7J8SJ58_GOSDV|nr:hypothetical protein [Gossypium davidsonii]
METEFAGLSLEEEEDEILQVQTEADSDRETEVLQLVGCFLTASIVHFPAMRSTMASIVHIMDLERVIKGSPWTFNNHLLILHNDSFCEERMTEGVETKEMGWDLTLRAQSRRAQMMTSVWLREEGEGQGEGISNMGRKWELEWESEE